MEVIKAGELNRRIVIKAPGAVDSLGQETGTATTVATVWAKKQPQIGRDIQRAGREVSENTETWTIRFRAGIEPKQFIEYGGLRYDIEAVLELGNKEGLDLITRLVR